jgi:hypothetical protein
MASGWRILSDGCRKIITVNCKRHDEKQSFLKCDLTFAYFLIDFEPDPSKLNFYYFVNIFPNFFLSLYSYLVQAIEHISLQKA